MRAETHTYTHILVGGVMMHPDVIAETARIMGVVLCNACIMVAVIQADLRWLIPCYLAVGIILVEQLIVMGIF